MKIPSIDLPVLQISPQKSSPYCSSSYFVVKFFFSYPSDEATCAALEESCCSEAFTGGRALRTAASKLEPNAIPMRDETIPPKPHAASVVIPSDSPSICSIRSPDKSRITVSVNPNPASTTLNQIVHGCITFGLHSSFREEVKRKEIKRILDFGTYLCPCFNFHHEPAIFSTSVDPMRRSCCRLNGLFFETTCAL